MKRLIAKTARSFDDLTPVFCQSEVNEWYQENFTLKEVKTNQPDPEQDNKILGFNGDYFFECEFDDGFWCNIGGEDMTHWMPLPCEFKNNPEKLGAVLNADQVLCTMDRIKAVKVQLAKTQNSETGIQYSANLDELFKLIDQL